MDGWTDGRMYGCTDVWRDGGMDGWMVQLNEGTTACMPV